MNYNIFWGVYSWFLQLGMWNIGDDLSKILIILGSVIPITITLFGLKFVLDIKEHL